MKTILTERPDNAARCARHVLAMWLGLSLVVSGLSAVVLAHRVARLDLPVRMVTDEEAAAAKANVESLSKNPNNQTLVG